VNRRLEDEVVGSRDCDFFPPSLAESYSRDDRAVIRSSEAIVDKSELVQNPHGSCDWFCTTKLPLFDNDGRAVGGCGITREVTKMTLSNVRFLSWEPVITTLLSDHASSLDSASMAWSVSLSVSQFNRQFRKRLRASLRNYLPIFASRRKVICSPPPS